jgi:phosphopantetheinyl transferase
MRFPSRYLFADEVAVPSAGPEIVCAAVKHSEVTHADSEWISYTLLTREELTDFNLIENPQHKLGVLASRFAVKDAVRLWMLRNLPHDGSPEDEASLHPAAFAILHDDLGQPLAVHQTIPTMPSISLAHSETYSIAVACEHPVGVDIEPADRDTQSILPQFASADEIAVLRALAEQQPELAWSTRLWCAKEATGKLLGTGLDGRPKDFQLLDADETGTMIVCHEPSGRRCVVTTFDMDGMIVAMACAESEWVRQS